MNAHTSAYIKITEDMSHYWVSYRFISVCILSCPHVLCDGCYSILRGNRDETSGHSKKTYHSYYLHTQKRKLFSTLRFINSNDFIYLDRAIFGFIHNALKNKKWLSLKDFILKWL